MITVLAGGVFDLFHIGHYRYLRDARKMGDRLVVGVTRNRNVNKGPGQPLYDEEERLAIVRAIRFVDEAVLVNSSLEALNIFRPNIFAKGIEYKGRMLPQDEDFCRATDVEIRFTDTEEKRPRDRLKQSP